MENNQIKVFLSGDYINVNYNTFINAFIKTFFFVSDTTCIEKFLFTVLKIEEYDKERILKSFTEEIIKFENDLINNQSNDTYYDKLCNYLFHINFTLLDKKHMDLVLNKLQVSDFNRNKVLNLFIKKQ